MPGLVPGIHDLMPAIHADTEINLSFRLFGTVIVFDLPNPKKLTQTRKTSLTPGGKSSIFPRMTPHPSHLAEEAALRAAFAQAHVRAQRTEAQQRMIAALIINIIRLLELWYAAWQKTRTAETTPNPADPNHQAPTQSNCADIAPHPPTPARPATTRPDSVHAQSPPRAPPHHRHPHIPQPARKFFLVVPSTVIRTT